jgi:branched-chain amino acid aminotransferase
MSAEPVKPEWGWIDGQFVPWDECVLHVRYQAIMTGASVFEGIRAYWNDQQGQLYIFRLREHLDRLVDSMKVMRMGQRVTPELSAAGVELLRRNNFKEDVHFMPVAYVGVGEEFGAQTKPLQEGFFITAVARPQTPALDRGVNVCISSWRRISDSVMPPRVKAAANYQNSRFAIMEARANGYDYAIFLNVSGTVAEGPGACVFMIRNGQVCTPPVTAGILESITRSTLIQLFRECLGLPVVEREIDRTELYLADEVFFCGTGWEVTPIVSVDRIAVGTASPGELAREIQKVYFRVARGDDPSFAKWLTPVYAKVGAGLGAQP